MAVGSEQDLLVTTAIDEEDPSWPRSSGGQRRFVRPEIHPTRRECKECHQNWVSAGVLALACCVVLAAAFAYRGYHSAASSTSSRAQSPPLASIRQEAVLVLDDLVAPTAKAPEDTSFDCEVGLDTWEQSWSNFKKLWCCQKESLGCPATPAPVPPPEVEIPATPAPQEAAKTTTVVVTTQPAPPTSPLPPPASSGLFVPGSGSKKNCTGPEEHCKLSMEEEQAVTTVATPQCADAFEACNKSKCCRDPVMTCYEKNPQWAACLETCEPGKSLAADAAEFRTPWSCEPLEELSFTPEYGIGPAGPEGQSLFCWALMMPDGYEVQLMRMLNKRRAGLFGCDRWAVYSNETVDLGFKIETQVIDGDMYVELGGKWYTRLNTEVFVNVWHAIFHDAVFWKAEWTVKLDPDSVFLPARLRKHLAKVDPMEKSYINNCRAGMHGPIEVVSHGAMDEFSKRSWECEEKLKHEWDLYGEDVFLRHCMKLLGTSQIDDYGLLSEDHCFENPSPCLSGKVAFHPFKTPKQYFACLQEATGKPWTTQ